MAGAWLSAGVLAIGFFFFCFINYYFFLIKKKCFVFVQLLGHGWVLRSSCGSSILTSTSSSSSSSKVAAGMPMFQSPTGISLSEIETLDQKVDSIFQGHSNFPC
jgi:hypothetical protein